MTVATAMEKKSMSDFVSGLFVSCPSEMLISDGHWGVCKHAAYLGRSIHRSMQPITGIRINAGLSLPSLTACVAGSLHRYGWAAELVP